MFDKIAPNGKKQDSNGGIKLASQLTDEQRQSRLALLAEHYAEGTEESPFDDDGLAIDVDGVCGPSFALPPEEVVAESDQVDEYFTVNPTPAWNVPFDPSMVPADK